MNEKGTFMVATLVNWKYGHVLEKSWSEMKSLYKKKLKSKDVRKNQLNTFVITEAEINSLPPRETRIEVEDAMRLILKRYADKINNLSHKDEAKKKNILSIYSKGFEFLGKSDLIPAYTQLKASKFDEIEKEIERIGREGSVIIWDLPGYERDKIILPECVATFQSDPDGGQKLVEYVDEVLIANFGRRFLPFSLSLITEAEGHFTSLNDVANKFTDGMGVADELISPLQTFIGVISGIQEVLKLFKREVTKVHEVSLHAFQFLHELPSSEIKQWATIEDPDIGNKITNKIDKIMDIIIEIKPKLRQLLSGNNKDTPVSPRLLDSMIKIDVTSGGLLSWVHRFQQLPSFTSLENGIAYEHLEGENYWPKDESALIEAQTLFKTFVRGGTFIYALRGVDVSVKQGEFVIIRGPSGAGKTTLLNILAGLDNPGRGTVFFQGEDLINLRDSKRSKIRRENFSFIFQSYALIPHLTAFENTKLPLDLSGFSEELAQGIQKLLDDVGIGQFSDHKPALLSGGQMQRLGIARALVNKPKMLFADEPTGDLDEVTGQAVMKLLKKYHEETGMTIILVTHDENVAKFATREILLMDGRVVDYLE